MTGDRTPREPMPGWSNAARRQMGEPLDGGAMDPRVARILLIYREAVAQASEKACSDLRDLGEQDPAALLLGPRR